MKVTRKDRGNSDDLDEQRRQYPSTADRRSEQRHVEHWHHNSSHERPSSRGSSLSSVSDDADDPRDIDRLRDIRRSRSPSHSGSRPRSESRHRGRGDSRSPSGNHSGTQKYSRSSHGRTHSGKRKHKDRSASREDRKRRKHKEKEREKAKEMSREKEKIRKRDDERRSVLTGKKVCPVFDFLRWSVFCSDSYIFCRSSSKSRKIKVIMRGMLIERIYFSSSTRLSSKDQIWILYSSDTRYAYVYRIASHPSSIV